MAITNYERVGKALELLTAGLKPFVERELKSVHQENWFEETRKFLNESHLPLLGQSENPHWDASTLLITMWNQWNDVFRKTLGPADRSLVSELREVRNRWAHQTPFSTDDAYRSLDSISRLLTAVSATEASEVEKLKLELLRVRFDDQVRTEKRKSANILIESEGVTGLKPWREVVTPHDDVAKGRYQQAEFAADLWQVYTGEGASEYRDPVEFFRRTFLTGGLSDLLINGLKRLAGAGGDPVIELQTNFGGGKTHSMLALYHLFCGASLSDLPGIEQIAQKAGVSKLTLPVKRVVIVGNKISPGAPSRKPDGTVVKTLWGELAWQLGGKEGFALVKEDDERATSPGDTLRLLFNKYGPCLILIDEWVAYARQLHESADLPGGTFDTHFTFAQTISEAAKAAKTTLLVVSIPASDGGGVSPGGHEIEDVEVGGERGRQALERLKNSIGRVESSWRPASAEEGFEIVRRRLFQNITDPKHFVAQDTTAKAFMDLYRQQKQEFPYECPESDYERKLKLSYPIHPEIFERLYQDWSSLVKFQRTRGVLRLMAAVIHCLWEREDKNPLILPANIPIDDPRVEFELTRYLPDQWVPVIEKDVDGPNSLPLRLDREKPNLGRYSACRRVARTVYLGSAPTTKAANRGMEDRRIKLGCVMPGEAPAIFGDALRHLSHSATYLYADGARYWYSTQPTVTKLADDRAEQLKADQDKIENTIRERLLLDLRQRGDFTKVHVCPESPMDVTDERDARLVVLGSNFEYVPKVEDCAALKQAKLILDQRGTIPRQYKNTLIFLAPDKTRLQDLEQAVRYFLAWDSIESDRTTLNLDAFQSRQVADKRKQADETVRQRIWETYQWVLAPFQEKPTEPAIQWNALRVQVPEALALRASKKLKNESLLIPKLGGALLKLELEKVPLWRGNFVEVKQLVEDFARYLYLPRLIDSQVLLSAISDGLSSMNWQQDTFAFADFWDEQAKRFRGLRAAQNYTLTDENHGIVVKGDIAAAQLDEDKKTEVVGGEPKDSHDAIPGQSGPPLSGAARTQTKKLTRFHGTIKLDSNRVARDAGKIAEEVIQHLNCQLTADVEVTLEIQANIPAGVSDQVIRIITENCQTLKFKSHGFEKE